MFDFWRNLSVSKKLYAVVGLMALLIASELFTLIFAMNTLSSVRAFVVGEGLWTKSQKDAIHSLYQYALFRDARYYQEFSAYFKIPAGDHTARIELLRPKPDLEVVRAGFLEGGNHPDDIDGMIKLLTRFHQVSFIRDAIQAWTDADLNLAELKVVAVDMHRMISQGEGIESPGVAAALSNVARINVRLTELETAFSSALSAGSRWLERFLMTVLALMVLTIEGTGLMLTFRFSRALGNSLKELHTCAEAVGQGDFKARATVRSKDELGQLAVALNKMTTDLAHSIGAHARLNQELEARVEERTSQLKVAKEEADLASAAKGIFLANMSHEIRTPLSAVLGYVELLGGADLTDAERREHLAIVQRNGELLATIINDILDLTKVEAGRLEVERLEVETASILTDVSSLLERKVASKGITFTIEVEEDVPAALWTDPVRLRQILFNLAGNAVKFTSTGGVRLTVSRRLTNGRDVVVFTVSDTGAGIAPEDVDRLFQPFVQADASTTRHFGGTGLGLALARKLARALGGDVTMIASKPGTGSTFAAVIANEPVDSAAQSSRLPPVQFAQRIVGAKVLVVDDSPDMRSLISRMLSKAGAKVDSAVDGREGVAKALDGDYEMVLMDLQMPVLDGYAALKELRRRGYGRPIVALTAHTMKEDRQGCLDLGFSEHLGKPIAYDRLVAAVGRFRQDAGSLG